MEYYDHNSGSERSRRRDPGYREYRDQYGSYTTSYREESPRDIRQQHGEYRNQHYRGRASHNYRYSRGGGRGGYQRGDRDFRDGMDMRSEQYRAPIRLAGNMMAGHAVIKVFAGFAGVMGLGAIAPILAIVAVYGLEMLVVVIQAYVFTILTCVYLNDALHPGH